MSLMPRVLLVEDDRSVAQVLLHTLKHTYDIDLASTGKLGLTKAAKSYYDAIMLDLNLPDCSGLAICQKLRSRGVIAPILILSGESRALTKINLLDAGANDYITKPFILGELKARLRAAMRRTSIRPRSDANLSVSGIELNSGTLIASRGKLSVKLRPKEFAILEHLMARAGSVVTRQELTDVVWGSDETVWTNTLDVHIKYLRDKLDRPFDKQLIRTIHGHGFMFLNVLKRTKRKVGDHAKSNYR